MTASGPWATFNAIVCPVYLSGKQKIIYVILKKLSESRFLLPEDMTEILYCLGYRSQAVLLVLVWLAVGRVETGRTYGRVVLLVRRQ